MPAHLREAHRFHRAARPTFRPPKGPLAGCRDGVRQQARIQARSGPGFPLAMPKRDQGRSLRFELFRPVPWFTVVNSRSSRAFLNRNMQWRAGKSCDTLDGFWQAGLSLSEAPACGVRGRLLLAPVSAALECAGESSGILGAETQCEQGPGPAGGTHAAGQRVEGAAGVGARAAAGETGAIGPADSTGNCRVGSWPSSRSRGRVSAVEHAEISRHSSCNISIVTFNDWRANLALSPARAAGNAADIE
jgi:hypothetical protein